MGKVANSKRPNFIKFSFNNVNEVEQEISSVYPTGIFINYTGSSAPAEDIVLTFEIKAVQKHYNLPYAKILDENNDELTLTFPASLFTGSDKTYKKCFFDSLDYIREVLGDAVSLKIKSPINIEAEIYVGSWGEV